MEESNGTCDTGDNHSDESNYGTLTLSEVGQMTENSAFTGQHAYAASSLLHLKSISKNKQVCVNS